MHKSIIHSALSFIILTLIVSSCTIVKKAPLNTPFLFENNIKIAGTVPKKELKELTARLYGQIEDSAQIRVASKVPWPSFPWIIPVPVITSPYPYTSGPVKQSALNMQYLLASLGFRRAAIEFDTTTKKIKNQLRTTTLFRIETGIQTKFDTVVYSFDDSILQILADQSRNASMVKRGKAFAYSAIDNEINRITDLFQNNGFVRFSKEDLVAEVDTSYTELINPAVDPFNLSLLLSGVARKQTQPEADVYFKLRSNPDLNHYKPYRIGDVHVFPESQPEDSIAIVQNESTDTIPKIQVHQTGSQFNAQFISNQVLMRPGSPYTREAYNKTINQFNKLGAWQNINMAADIKDSLGRIDYLLKLQPAKRQYFSIDLEGSSIINTSQLIQVGSGRVGLANNFTLRNRNIGKRAIQLENSLRAGIEFNNFKKVLSGEITLTNRMTFPWMVAPLVIRSKSYFQQARTVASVDYSYIDRFQFFQLNTVNTFLGYEWKPNANTSWQIRPFNIEYTQFRPDSLFLESIQDFPLLLYTYNNGLIIGMNALFNRNLSPGNNKRINLLKIYAEESGLLTGSMFKSQTASGRIFENLYRFIKADVEVKHIVTHQNSSLHLRAFAGAGLSFKTASRTGDVTLPFFKSFIAGGPNSMRGWPIRKLGIGSNIFYDTIANGRFSDKYADIQLEGNMEYRFNLFPFYGFWMRGALFTDIGNIWFRNALNSTLPGAGFSLKDFSKQLAVASGMGARIDFNYFLLRFDLGFPIKDPRYGPENKGNPTAERFYSSNAGGWFVNKVWNRPAFQFAIGYPF